MHLNVNVPAFSYNLEFRTYFYDTSWIKQQNVSIFQGQYPHWDIYLASFPGV